MIKDSGMRESFSTGAVRDAETGKGRCDLLPLDTVANIMDDCIIDGLYYYQHTRDLVGLHNALNIFITDTRAFKNYPDMVLEVAKHFEEGAQKYGERNWEKGIPEERYIDSAVRHYLKYKRGDDDERHDRAFAWNVMCLIWTHTHITEKGES